MDRGLIPSVAGVSGAQTLLWTHFKALWTGVECPKETTEEGVSKSLNRIMPYKSRPGSHCFLETRASEGKLTTTRSSLLSTFIHLPSSLRMYPTKQLSSAAVDVLGGLMFGTSDMIIFRKEPFAQTISVGNQGVPPMTSASPATAVIATANVTKEPMSNGPIKRMFLCWFATHFGGGIFLSFKVVKVNTLPIRAQGRRANRARKRL
jgi:hypothetical protein